MSARTKVNIRGRLLSWARKRSGLSIDDLRSKFPALLDWEKEVKQPSYAQLEAFSKKTRAPLGYFFLEDPPIERLPVPHFRTVHDGPVADPSPELIDTIYAMLRRQEWMRDYLIEQEESPLSFVASETVASNVVDVADRMRNTLGLSVDWAQQYGTWQEACDALRNSIDRIGILFARNGVVGNNNFRHLQVEEFRGFVLVDRYAPLIFVNGADWEAAQMFTMAHELAHVWIGSGSIFDLRHLQPFNNEQELFCNKVAAEFLVPETEMRVHWNSNIAWQKQIDSLRLRFKVSPIVIARRALDLQFITYRKFIQFLSGYGETEIAKRGAQRKKSGGDFYNNQNLRIGKRFAHAVFVATFEGKLPYREAYSLTGLRGKTFDQYAKKLGVL
jgi:Zn-dependent peptidase ImmA (M78 family)